MAALHILSYMRGDRLPEGLFLSSHLFGLIALGSVVLSATAQSRRLAGKKATGPFVAGIEYFDVFHLFFRYVPPLVLFAGALTWIYVMGALSSCFSHPDLEVLLGFQIDWPQGTNSAYVTMTAFAVGMFMVAAMYFQFVHPRLQEAKSFAEIWEGLGE